MTQAERAYTIQNRELLAVVQCLKKFKPELLGMKFIDVTDHQALLYYSSKRCLSIRQVCWTNFLANFDITWQYRPERENVAADGLSRKTAELPTVKAREQAERNAILLPQNDFQPHLAAITAEKLEKISKGADLVELIIEENRQQKHGTVDDKLVVPEKTQNNEIFLRTALLREAHELHANGEQNKTVEEIRHKYFWKKLRQDAKRYVRNCLPCGRNKKRRDKTPGLLHSLPILNHVWEQVVVDKDMPKDDRGCKYVWVFICKFSPLIAALAGKKTDTAEKLAERYYYHLYRFLDVPDRWLTDNAGPFVSEFLSTLNKLTKTKHHHRSSLHPQTPAAVERTNSQLDEKLRAYIDKYQTKWRVHLPALDLAHNASWHSSLAMSPLKVLLGLKPRNPLSLPLAEMDTSSTTQELARQSAVKAQMRQEHYENLKSRPVDFTVGDLVYVSKKGLTTKALTTRLDSQYV